MSGLSSYPRSYGEDLPPHVAQALLRHLPGKDRALYGDRYRRESIPPYLRPNHADSVQPGAIPATEPLPNPPLNNLDFLFQSRSLYVGVDAERIADLEQTIRDQDDPMQVVTAFSGQVLATVLQPDVTLCRIVGLALPISENERQRFRDSDWRMTNRPLGEWWVIKDLLVSFRSEAELRAALALRTEWNGDHGFISVTLQEPAAVLLGPAASQESVNPGAIFPGGGLQIYWPSAKHHPVNPVWSPMPWSSGS